MMTSPHTQNSPPLRSTLFIVSGPSGVGKDTVLNRVFARLQRIRPSVSATTRAPRPGEVHGVDYFFVTPDAFAAMRHRGDLLEYAEVHGHCYGTPRTWVLDELRGGTDVVLEIDVQGALQVKTAFPDAVLIFMAPPSWETLAARLRGRATESEEALQLRLHNARREMLFMDQYQYLVINDQLDDAVERVAAIVTAERCRPWKQDLETLLRGVAADG